MIAFEASPLCYCPDDLTGEFANVALLLVARKESGEIDDIRFKFETHTHRLSGFFHNLWDGPSFTVWRNQIDRHVRLARKNLLEEKLNNASYSFDVIQETLHSARLGAFYWGEIVLGQADSTDEAFEQLYHDLVSRHLHPIVSTALSEREMWERKRPVITEALQAPISNNRVAFDSLVGEERVYLRWRNTASAQFLDPLSFMVKESDTIVEKGQRMAGRLIQRAQVMSHKSAIWIAPPEDPALKNAAEKQYNSMRQLKDVVRTVITDEGHLQEYLETVKKEAEAIAG